MTQTAQEIGEKGLLRRIQSYLGESTSIIRTFSEDCAVIDTPGDHYLLYTMDVLVEGVHFERDFMPAYYVGRKGLKANLSDIAAMGGEPQYFLVSLGLPPETSVKIVDELYEGMNSVSKESGVLLIGGNVSNSRVMFVDITVQGRVMKKNVRMRSDARIGDLIFVSGRLGAAAEGLKLLKDGFRCLGDSASGVILPRGQTDSSYVHEAVFAQFDPPAELRTAQFLVRLRGVHAMMDLSDGLASDLGEICRESKVGAEIELSKIPVHPAALHWERKRKMDPLQLALQGGEDYHLLFTASATAKKRLAEKERSGAWKFFEIGKIVDAKRGIIAFDEHGKECALGSGYEHFKPDRKTK